MLYIKRGGKPMKRIAWIWQAYRRLPLAQWLQALAGAWLWSSAVVVMWREDSFLSLPFAQSTSLWLLAAVVCLGGVVVATLAARFAAWRLPPRFLVSGVCALSFSLASRAEGERTMYLFLVLAAVQCWVQVLVQQRVPVLQIKMMEFVVRNLIVTIC